MYAVDDPAIAYHEGWEHFSESLDALVKRITSPTNSSAETARITALLTSSASLLKNTDFTPLSTYAPTDCLPLPLLPNIASIGGGRDLSVCKDWNLVDAELSALPLEMSRRWGLYKSAYYYTGATYPGANVFKMHGLASRQQVKKALTTVVGSRSLALYMMDELFADLSWSEQIQVGDVRLALERAVALGWLKPSVFVTNPADTLVTEQLVCWPRHEGMIFLMCDVQTRYSSELTKKMPTKEFMQLPSQREPASKYRTTRVSAASPALHVDFYLAPTPHSHQLRMIASEPPMLAVTVHASMMVDMSKLQGNGIQTFFQMMRNKIANPSAFPFSGPAVSYLNDDMKDTDAESDLSFGNEFNDLI